MVSNIRKFSQKKEMHTTPSIDQYKKRLEAENNDALNCKKEDLANRFDTAILIFAGDWHIGVPNCDLESAVDTINYVLNTPNAIMFCLGDMLNTAILGAVSSNYEDVVYPQEQWRIFIDMFNEIALAGKLTVVHEGNHERRIEKQTGVNVIEQATRAMETYNNRGVWTDFSKLSAPYYAQRKIVLNNKDCKNKKFEIDVITHHGDGVSNIFSVQKLQEQSPKSCLNVVGHLHKFNLLDRTIQITSESGQVYKHRVRDIILPSNGDGYYGNVKMFGKKNNAPAVAIEITSVKNPLYEENSTARVKEQEFIPAMRSVPILASVENKKQDRQINLTNKIIKKQGDEFKKELNEKLFEIVNLFQKAGLELTTEVVDAMEELSDRSPKNTIEPKTKIKQIKEEEFSK